MIEQLAGHLMAQHDRKALEGEGYTACKLLQIVNKPLLLVTTRAVSPQSSCFARSLPTTS